MEFPVAFKAVLRVDTGVVLFGDGTTLGRYVALAA